MATDAPLRRRLAALRSAFLERAATQLERADGLADRHEQPDALSELQVLMHTLKGSAATFGGGELSALAAEAEGLLLAAPPLPTAADLHQRFAAMRAALRAMDEKTDTGVEDPAAAAPAAEGGSDGPIPVYLCEDDAILAAQLSGQLACFGYACRTFGNLAALEEAIAEHPPGALVMDVMLPEGEDSVFAAVRRFTAGDAAVPTLFLSGRVDFETRLRAVRAGGRGYMAKPVQLVELVDQLDRTTGRTVPEPCRVLVVDDEPEVAAYHGLILQQAGMVVRTIHAPLDVLAVMEEFHPDLLLMDMYMPGCSGRELATVIRQMPHFLSIPIVFLSSETDAGKQTSALGVGGDGFLVKPIDPSQLVAQVAIRAERMRNLRALMVRDSLTGLLNHNALKQFLNKEVMAARRTHRPVCFAMIDVDHFKSVNDSYGHPVGDQVLMALSRLLRQQLRSTDVVGRYGGEEFAVILTDVAAADAVRVLDSLREHFSRLRFHAGESEFCATFSAGVAQFPATGASVQELCEEADRALYQGKRQGRNRVVAAAAPA